MPRAVLGITRKIGIASNAIKKVMASEVWKVFLNENSIPGLAVYAALISNKIRENTKVNRTATAERTNSAEIVDVEEMRRREKERRYRVE